MVNSSGNSGPLIFLAAGKKIDSKALKNLDINSFPPGSTVVMTPTSYVTNVTCIQIVPIICKLIIAMHVI